MQLSLCVLLFTEFCYINIVWSTACHTSVMLWKQWNLLLFSLFFFNRHGNCKVYYWCQGEWFNRQSKRKKKDLYMTQRTGKKWRKRFSFKKYQVQEIMSCRNTLFWMMVYVSGLQTAYSRTQPGWELAMTWNGGIGYASLEDINMNVVCKIYEIFFLFFFFTCLH